MICVCSLRVDGYLTQAIRARVSKAQWRNVFDLLNRKLHRELDRGDGQWHIDLVVHGVKVRYRVKARNGQGHAFAYVPGSWHDPDNDTLWARICRWLQ